MSWIDGYEYEQLVADRDSVISGRDTQREACVPGSTLGAILDIRVDNDKRLGEFCEAYQHDGYHSGPEHREPGRN